MEKQSVFSIGEVLASEDGFAITVKEDYRKALTALEGFSHLNILWWADDFESMEYRSITTVKKPYKKGPETIGVFATRSPLRPNPIAVSLIYIFRIDYEKGIIFTPYIDAHPGTPVLDIKPHQPSTDVTRSASVPAWCSHWPESIEDSADFDWEAEFNF